MTLSTGKTGRGVFIEVSDGESPPTWSKIGNVTSIDPKGQSAAEVDFTHLLSTGAFREFQQGFKDPGTVDIALHLDPTDTIHQQLQSDFVSGVVRDYRIDFSGAGWAKYLNFQAFCQNPGDVTVNVDNPIGGTASLRRTGATTWSDKV